MLRTATAPVPTGVLEAAWDDPEQYQRSLAALIDDGLVSRCPDGSLALPGDETRGSDLALAD